MPAETILATNAETLTHIRRVQTLLKQVLENLTQRLINHDQSKLTEPEASVFAEKTAQLKGLEYGSEEYKACLASMRPALENHYARNSHHPEHYTTGMQGMSLLDLIEMLVDWKAASERHATGDILKSVEINQSRFGYSNELKGIFLNTIRELQLTRKTWYCLGCGASGHTLNFCDQCGAGRKDYDPTN